MSTLTTRLCFLIVSLPLPPLWLPKQVIPPWCHPGVLYLFRARPRCGVLINETVCFDLQVCLCASVYVRACFGYKSSCRSDDDSLSKRPEYSCGFLTVFTLPEDQMHCFL
ncbi:hypothetical protein BJV82DRAFT_176013 [Fennellomyces sp. T-0311]|nr:hypothetical protein BJV82DRAFT_176013 [Fennellomyces sp. T-0311]